MEFLRAAFKTRAQAEWIEALSKLDLGWAPVLDMAEAVKQPQARAREMVMTDDRGRKHIGNPIKFTEEPARFGFDSPAFNRDAESLVVGLGYSAEDFLRMRAAGVFGKE
jgi:crotonobetainyl-CoA:carnitine CoA-transferase CaiB-like acyl-CoA transferase